MTGQELLDLEDRITNPYILYSREVDFINDIRKVLGAVSERRLEVLKVQLDECSWYIALKIIDLQLDILKSTQHQARLIAKENDKYKVEN